jgi:hypothetical protein
MTLVIPLGMLVVVIALWALGRRWLQLRERGAGMSAPVDEPDRG